MKTGGHALTGLRHDWTAMNLSLFAGSPFLMAYGMELACCGCEFAPADRLFSSSLVDGS